MSLVSLPVYITSFDIFSINKYYHFRLTIAIPRPCHRHGRGMCARRVQNLSSLLQKYTVASLALVERGFVTKY